MSIPDPGLTPARMDGMRDEIPDPSVTPSRMDGMSDEYT